MEELETAMLPSEQLQPVTEQAQPIPSMTKAEFDAAVAATLPPAPAIVTPVRREKVAILGFVQHFRQAPFDDDSFEIWGLNELYDHIPRWTRWFEIHDRALYENDRNRTSTHVQKLKTMTCPVFMQRHWDDIPTSVEYPMGAICQMFANPCPEARPYLTNSITYEILLAIAEQFKEIHIYGVDMAHDSEYGQQRPSCEWAVGIAQGRGIKTYIPAESDLLKTNFLYGYEKDAAAAFDRKLAARVAEVQTQLTNLDNQFMQLVEARAQYRGAHQDLLHWQKNWKALESPPTTSS